VGLGGVMTVIKNSSVRKKYNKTGIKPLEDMYPFTDQEPFPEPMMCVLAEYDKSEPYELDSGAIFLTKKGKFRGVVVSGCS
jgi:hypothetical protein